MANLKPCPFCGNPKPAFVHDLELVPHGVRCSNCKVYVRFPDIDGNKDPNFGVTMRKIAERWNRRKA